MGLKFKKIIKNIFPSKTNPEIQKGNIKDLVYFCSSSADQLKNIAEYLFNKAKLSYKKNKLDIVKACIFIISELIVRVRNILLYGPALKMIDFLLQKTQNPDLQIEATKTFAQYASVQTDGIVQFQSEITGFIQWFIGMSKNNSSNDIQKRQIRTEGLRGITAYVSLLNLYDELDSFITKNYNQTAQQNSTVANATNINNNNNNNNASNENIIYIFLDNMQYTDSIEQQLQQNQQVQANTQNTTENVGNNQEDSNLPADVRAQATECLIDLSRRVENVTVGTLIYSICNYLDQNQRWGTSQFSNECLKAVSENIKPQHYTILVTRYLSHMEMPHQTSVITKIVQSTISVIKSGNPTISLIITSLLKVLVRSIEVSNRQPVNDIDDQVRLQGVVIDTIGEIAKKIKPTKSKVEIMFHIMSFLRDVQSSSSKTTSPIHGMNVIILDHVQCILQVSQTLHDINPPKQLNDFTLRLIELYDNELTSPEARIFIQKIFQSILLPGNKSFEQFINPNNNNNTSTTSLIPTTTSTTVTTTTNNPTNNTSTANTPTNNNDGVDEYLNDNLQIIRDFIFNSFMKPNNQPYNIISLFRNLIIILYRFKNKEVTQSIPMMMKLQAQANQMTSFRLSRSIHLAISSYFLMLSRVYSSIPMEQYMNSINEKRQTTNNSCRYLGYDSQIGMVIMNNKHKYNTETKDSTSNQDLLIDHEKISEILSNINSLSTEYPDIKQKLHDTNNEQPPIIKSDLDNNNDTTNNINNNTISKLPIINTTGTSNDSNLSGSNININRSNTIQVLKKSNNSDISLTSGSKSESSTFSFESFKKFTDIVDNTGYMTTNGTNNTNGTIKNINNIVLSKDLSYDFVSNKVEEVQSISQEYNQLLNILKFTETSRQNQIKSQKQNPLHSNLINTSIINHDVLDPTELSSSCTLVMNIQNVLEKLF